MTDEDFQPKVVKDARRRSDDELKKLRNSIYLILRDIKGRDNAIHAKDIIEEAKKRFGIDYMTKSDITETVNKLRVIKHGLPFLMSERAKGFYNAVTRDEMKAGIYEKCQMIVGHWNQFDTMRDIYTTTYGYDIPDDPLEYKREVGKELRGDDEDD